MTWNEEVKVNFKVPSPHLFGVTDNPHGKVSGYSVPAEIRTQNIQNRNEKLSSCRQLVWSWCKLESLSE
jgi:hypothetical protein